MEASCAYPSVVLESRPVRYFLAVAQEGSFARASERLGVAAPALSRAIAKLEAQLGVRLFDRTTRSVDLTEAGAELLQEATPAIEALDAAGRRTQRRAATRSTVQFAVKAGADGGLLTPILDHLAETREDLRVAVRLCSWGEQAGLIRRGEADVALVYEPFEHHGLDSEVILVEPHVAALPTSHPFADRAAVHLADLDLGEPDVLHLVENQVREHRVDDLAQLITLVGLGTTRTLLPTSVAQHYPRRDVAYVPVVDAPSAALAVAWHARTRSLDVAALVAAATEVGTPTSSGA